MRKILVSLLSTILTFQLCFARLEAKVDERFELTSVMFALAGAPEYCQCRIPSYFQEVCTEFMPYDRTPAINFIRELHQFHRIGFNAVPAITGLLEIRKGEICLKPQYDISKISEIDERWDEALLTKFLKSVNEFYTESNFHRFFKKHAPLYELAEERMNAILSDDIENWFAKFYGQSLNTNLEIYLSLMNGPSNYSFSSGILIGISNNENGIPTFDKGNTMPLLIHELSHHFTNALVDKYWTQLQEPATRLYTATEELFRTQSAYAGIQTVMNEWLTELVTICYMQENDGIWVKPMVARDIRKGFVWMRRSVDFMTNFVANRNLYPYFEDFMPQLISFAEFTANNIEWILRENEMSSPYITNVYPAMNSDISGVKEVVVTFSCPMLGSYGFNGSGSPDASPLYFDSITWSEDGTKMLIGLKTDMIDENKEYGLLLRPQTFLSADYFLLNQNSCRLSFNTYHK